MVLRTGSEETLKGLMTVDGNKRFFIKKLTFKEFQFGQQCF